MENIEIIRRACIVANPGIVADPEYYGKEGRTIRLADVLLAMQGKVHDCIGVDMNGYFLDCDDHMQNLKILDQSWNLRSDDLSAQSPETLSFLADLLANKT